MSRSGEGFSAVAALARNSAGTVLLAATVLSSLPAGPAKAQVTILNAAGYHAGGVPLGGGHPTACAHSFTVPEGKDRLLLVFGPAKYDPASAS